jgi:hypothetical protein
MLFIFTIKNFNSGINIYIKVYTMAENTKVQFDLDNNINNLYHISLQYYTMLKLKSHPMIHLITKTMDNLIALKKDTEKSAEDKKLIFDDVHAMAYSDIQSIYDYDKELDEKNGISSEIGKLDVKVSIESGDDKNDNKINDQVSSN